MRDPRIDRKSGFALANSEGGSINAILEQRLISFDSEFELANR